MLFLDFLKRYPSAGQCVHQQLNQEFLDVCQQLRLLSLTTTAPRKVAGLFLAWSRQQAASLGVNRIRCTMTHEEIGEHIGVSRETVCRTLADLKERRMLEQRGSLFLITDISALQQQAGSENEEAGDYE
jgi:CRP-like cAMP-binding protein